MESHPRMCCDCAWRCPIYDSDKCTPCRFKEEHPNFEYDQYAAWGIKAREQFISGQKLTWESIRNFQPLPSCQNDLHIVYKKNRPLDRVLCVVQNGKVLVLDYIGPGVEYLANEDLLAQELSWDPNEPNREDDGVFIWEGSMNTIRYYYGDYDIELEGEFRLATEQEWQAHLNDEYVWDRSLWIE